VLSKQCKQCLYKNKVCVCVNFDFIEFGGMTQRKFWYGLW